MTSLRLRLWISHVIVLLVVSIAGAGVVVTTFTEQHDRAILAFFQQHYFLPIEQQVRYLPSGGLRINSARLPQQLEKSHSGIYAQLHDNTGQIIWRSPSLCTKNEINQQLVIAEVDSPLRLDWQVFAACTELEVIDFPRAEDSSHDIRLQTLADTNYVLHYAASKRIGLGQFEQRYTLQIAVSRQQSVLQQLAQSLQQTQRRGWQWLFAGIIALALIQLAASYWLLAPLRRAGREIEAIQAGRQQNLSDDYATELLPLTGNLNTLMQQNQARLKRYRERLDDLAHSFKTPLAVQKAAAENEKSESRLRRIVLEQVERMLQEVNFHLKRAATYGQLTLSKEIMLKPVAEKNINAFKILHERKGLQFSLVVDEVLRFPGYEGDLLEILGNLTENACKAARQQVKIAIYKTDKTTLIIDIEDDGPGIPVAEREWVFQRGKRGTAYSEGSGLGLALVKDIVEGGYDGRVEMRDSDLGGVCVRVVFCNSP